MKQVKFYAVYFICFLLALNLQSQSPGACLNFDGVDDFVAIPNNGSVFNVPSNHIKTAQLWYKSTSTSGNNVRIFSTGSANWTSGFWLGFATNSNNLMLEMSDGVSTGQVITSTVSTRGDNTWHHATAAMNGSIAMLYIDGILQGTTNISGEGAMNCSGGSVHVGNSYNNEAFSFFEGSVDELRIWNKTLCSTEILNSKNCELLGTASGLVAYYKFNQGIYPANNATITMLSGFAPIINTGTLTNFSLIGLTSNWANPGGVVSGNICSITAVSNPTIVSSGTGICAGQNVTLTVLGSSQYTWNPSGSTNSVIVVSPSVSTMYSVSSQCTRSDSIYIAVSNLSISAFASSPSICAGQSASITVNGANTYTWLPGNTHASTLVVSPTVSSNYTVLGSNGICTNSTVVNITVNNLVNISVTNQTICAGTTVTLQATGATSYTWSTGAPFSAIVVSPSVTTVYTVSGSIGSCTDTKTVMVVVGSLPISVSSLSLCAGNSGSLIATGATNYAWSNGQNGSSILVSPNTTTSYTVTGIQGSCTGSAVTVVTVAPNPTITAAVTPSNQICNGTTIVFNPSGACSYTYSSGSATITPSSSGSYTIIGMNCTTGCVGSHVVNISVQQPTPLVVSASSPSICSSNTTTLTASGASSYSWSNGSSGNSINVSPTTSSSYSVLGFGSVCTNTGIVSILVVPSPTLALINQTICPGITTTIVAIGAANYSWNTSATTSSIIVSPIALTVYTVTGANANCIDTKTVSIDLGPAMTVPISGPTVICFGSSTTLSAYAAVSYTWSNGSNNSAIVVNPTVNTVYTVSASNGTCIGSSQHTVSVNLNPTITLVNAPGFSICPGATVNLVAGGASTYTWSHGATGSVTSVSPIANTTYSVIGETAGCSSTASLAISIGPAPQIGLSASSTVACVGKSTTLTATGAQTYTWSNGLNSNSIVVSPSINTIYSVIGNTAGCIGNASISLIALNPSPLNLSITPSNSICLGKTVQLIASGNFTSITWLNNGFNTGSIAVTPTLTSTYTVIGTAGANACSNSSVVNITVNNNPITAISFTGATCGKSCDAKLTATASGGAAPYTYSLSGNSCSVFPCTNLCAGLYTLYTTDNAGCSSFNIFSIANVLNSMVANITTSHVSCSSCNNGALLVTPVGGNAPYTYTWTPSGATTALISGLASGCYTVGITDAGGCSTQAWSCIGIFTGINNTIVYEEDVELYPNPVKQQLHLQLKGFVFNYKVYNALGQVCMQQSERSEQTLVPFENLSSGIYIVEINVGNATFRKKIMKE